MLCYPVFQDIKIFVEPKFISASSDPDHNIYCWDYKTSIINYHDENLQIVKRVFYNVKTTPNSESTSIKWLFKDNKILAPGDTYSISNFAKHVSESAIIEGIITFQTSTKELIHIQIPAFSIDCPYAIRIYH